MAEALEYIGRIEKFRFFSSGHISSTGSGPAGSVLAREPHYPENRKPAEKTQKEKELEAAERLLANSDEDRSERDKMLEERYGDILPL